MPAEERWPKTMIAITHLIIGNKLIGGDENAIVVSKFQLLQIVKYLLKYTSECDCGMMEWNYNSECRS